MLHQLGNKDKVRKECAELLKILHNQTVLRFHLMISEAETQSCLSCMILELTVVHYIRVMKPVKPARETRASSSGVYSPAVDGV